MSRTVQRQEKPGLKETIACQAYRFDFFQLVYLLEHWRRDRDDGPARRGLPMRPIGRRGPMSAEGLRLRPDPGLGFSPADVRRAELVSSDDSIYRVVVNFMGLYGVASPSPVYFTELINASDVETESLSQFLDLFNHRLLSFFYRAWQKYRYPYRYEPGAKDEFSNYALGFVGLREPEVKRQTHLPVPRLVKYLGLLGPQTRPLINLRLLIADYFRLPRVRIKRWILRWVAIAPDEQNRIGKENCRLGKSLSLGETVADRCGKFRVRIGPVPYETYRRFLPDSERYRQLCALIHLWAGDRFDYDVEFVIHREDIPEARLEGPLGAQLGWTGWVTSQPGLAKDPSIIFHKLRRLAAA